MKKTMLFFLLLIGLSASAQEVVMVLARISDPAQKATLEDESVRELKSSGIEAVAAHAVVSEADMKSEETFLAKLKTLNVKGLIAYVDPTSEARVKNTPSVNAYAGVPVKVGIFRVNLGTNVPIAGGSKVKTRVYITAEYYDNSSSAALYSNRLKGDLSKGVSALAKDFSKEVVKDLKKKKFL